MRRWNSNKISPVHPAGGSCHLDHLDCHHLHDIVDPSTCHSCHTSMHGQSQAHHHPCTCKPTSMPLTAPLTFAQRSIFSLCRQEWRTPARWASSWVHGCRLAPVGVEPAPALSGALSHRLGPLGQSVDAPDHGGTTLMRSRCWPSPSRFACALPGTLPVETDRARSWPEGGSGKDWHQHRRRGRGSE